MDASNANTRWIFTISTVCITAITLAASLGSAVCIHRVGYGPYYIDVLFSLSMCCLIAVFIINVIMLFWRGSRIVHSWLLIIIIISSAGIFGLLGSDSPGLRRFRQGSFTNYDRAIARIALQRSSLVSTNRDLNMLIGGVASVWGRTNLDGSIEIHLNIEDSRGEEYMYYTGTNLEQNGTHSNVVYFKTGPRYYFEHITNNWYRLLPWP